MEMKELKSCPVFLEAHVVVTKIKFPNTGSYNYKIVELEA